MGNIKKRREALENTVENNSARPNKVTFFHPYFCDGGVERTNIRLSRFFISKGYMVDFLSLTFESHHLPEIETAGIHIVQLEAAKTSQAIREIRTYIRRQREIYKLHIIGCQSYANVILILACTGLHRGIDVLVAERLSLDSLTKYSTNKKDKLILYLMKKLYKKADCITANSEELASDLSEFLSEKVVCTYNPTYTEDFGKYARDRVEEEWFSENIPIVLSVARLEKVKDLTTLIRAFSIVHKKMDCRLVIIGNGSEKERLESLIKELQIEDCSKLLPFDPNPYKYMARASVFVVSSLAEGLCNTIIEATAVKTPCVVTDCKSGSREIVLDGKGGTVVPVGNVQKMAEGIAEVLENPEKAKKKMEIAYGKLDRFTEETGGNTYLKCFKKL